MTLMPCAKQTRYKVSCFLIVVFIFSYFVYSENTWSTPDDGKFKQEINAILQKYQPKDAHVGISIFSVSGNRSLYKNNSKEQFVIASNMKLFTTAAALVYLGSDFEYKTEILYRGVISSDGKLDGDIIIKGSGDPNISGRFFDGKVTTIPDFWADSIKKHGIKVISGDIIADDSIFDREFIHGNWPKDQLSEWYCAPISGLSFNDNCIDIILKPGGNPGDLAKVEIKPDTNYIKVNNKCNTTTLKSKHIYSLYRKPFTNQINVKGQFWSKANPTKAWITINNPPLYVATVFKEILAGKNIRVMGEARIIDETDIKTRHGFKKLVITTSSLRQSITVANKRSQGFYAEQILKTMGAIIKNEGSFSGGLDVIRDFLTKIGIQENQYHLDDGSGLSKKNKATPDTMTTLLKYMYSHKNAGIFVKSLPVSGTDGTLQNRLKDEPFKSRVKAKTGYVYGARTLSGYVQTLNNEEIIAFSILVNKIKGGRSWQANQLQDAICRYLVAYN